MSKSPPQGAGTASRFSNGKSAERLEKALGRIADPVGEGQWVFTHVWADEARKAAAESDRRALDGKAIGPLDGAIISIKDLFGVAGETTRAGASVLRHCEPETRDAAIISRLRAAGAILIGRTNMSEFAFSGVGNNMHFGTPGNPFDRARIPGGSSSGAVVSVMDDMADIGIGSDTGGSLRIPAALSGAVGFKPTSGQTPTMGAFPLSTTLDVVGPIARNVADCAVADAIMRGTAPLQPMAVDPRKTAFIVPRGRLFDDTTPEVFAAFEQAMNCMRGAGIEIIDGSIETELDALAELDALGAFPSFELAGTLTSLGIHDLGEVDPRIRVRIEKSRGVTGESYAEMLRRRGELVAKMDARLQMLPTLLLPTVPMTAPLIADIQEDAPFDRVNMALLRNTRVANLFDLPSISLPIPCNGLPVGLMLMGRRGNDQALLNVATVVEKILTS